VVAVEEDDGFGGGVVDMDQFCGLRNGGVTCLMSILSLRTRVSRWNFCCCVTLLYLQVLPVISANNIISEKLNLGCFVPNQIMVDQGLTEPISGMDVKFNPRKC
jgi:hypothetical protein